MKAPAIGWQLLLAFVLSIELLAGTIDWLQNVHIITANGMYKSIQAEPWISDPANARLDASNYLYFPIYGALCRLLDWIGIQRGVPWKQFAYLNAFWSSVGVVIVYAFVHRVTGSVLASVLAVAFHIGSGFVLLLSVINEDIMPGYVAVLGAMALAGLWFDRPTYLRVGLVGALFTLGWLIEWRLIFPTLPALVLALAIAPDAEPRAWLRRLAMIGTLLVSILAVSGVVQLFWDGHNGAVGLHDMLWTGKGIASGWAGLSADKLWLMLSGVGNYLFLVGGFGSVVAAKQGVWLLALSVLLQLAILVGSAIALWPWREEPRLRTIAVVFLGTLGAGQVLNIYSQPQDPQMQVNVMAWLSVAWALMVASLLPRVRTSVVVGLTLLSFLPLVWNIVELARSRGGDAKSVAALASLERRFPPESTVYVYWGFEPIAMWHYALWSRTWDWDGAAEVEPAPSINPRFKWIAIDAGAIRHPQWTAEQHAASIKRDIDLAFERGYRVVVADVWNWSVDELADQLGSLAAANRAPVIHDLLHSSYEVGPPVYEPAAGTYYELRRR